MLPPGFDLDRLTPEQQDELLRLLEEEQSYRAGRLFYALYPERDTIWDGPTILDGQIVRGQTLYARSKYPKHMEFFRVGATYRERCLMAANRTGKTFGGGGYEVACHLTGQYPAWWEGRRFNHAVSAWAAGDTYETTRDIVQHVLFGSVVGAEGNRKGFDGRGIVPADCIGQVTWRSGVADLADTVRVKHSTGGWSVLGLKSYDQGRKKFQGTAKHVCIAAGQLVQMADGTLRPIENIAVGDVVLGLGQRGIPVPRRVLAVHDNGERDCITLMPKNGTMSVLTPDHEVYWGYRSGSKTSAASVARVAQIVPGTFWPETTEARPDAWYVWAALVIAEGSTNQRKVTNGDERSMARAIELLPPEARVRKKVFGNGHVPDWYLYWREFWADMPGGLAHEKSIPDWVFKAPKDKARLFVRWLFMGDGWANHKTVSYATTSEVLATQLTVLLNRLGIRASVYVRRSKGAWREQYWVSMTKAVDVARFIEDIGIEGKEEATARVLVEARRRLSSLASRGRNFVRDHVKHDRAWILGRAERVRLKSSKVRGRSSAGVRRVYDLTVDGEHRFLVGTNLVSNCWLDEEPPLDVYGECLIRTATTGGIVLMTFTPLLGISDVVLEFMPAEQRPGGFDEGVR
jgi:phage terminase large subunit-like protein